MCRHCEEAPCVAACMAGALYYSSKGLILQNSEQCVGCGMCVMVCPFGAIRLDPTSHRSRKCQGCMDFPEPPCITACNPKALQQQRT
ncbi:MAG: 4Fe-4S dicluster domain-containing protein [Bacillota bacterium]